MKETHEDLWTAQRLSLVCGRAWPIVLGRPTECSFGLFKQVLFVGAFAKLQKAAINFLMSVCLTLSVHPSVRIK